MMRLRPIAHFALLGALLFGLTRWLAGGSPAVLPPRLDDGLEEEVLYRAALARGLDRDDPVVQARLLQDARFLDPAAGDDAVLYRDAIDLGLAQGDLVVRRRLVERMQRLLQDPALTDEPSDAELQAFLDAHADRFAAPARVRLAQVFLSRQRRGAGLESDAQRLLERLAPADAARAAALGDPLPLPAELPSASTQDLAALFGARFAAAVAELEPGRWQGPLTSPYGLHLVWVYERVGARQPPLVAVRGQVRAALRDERAAAALRDGVRRLRAADASPATGG
jgi:hypothetical protein